MIGTNHPARPLLLTLGSIHHLEGEETLCGRFIHWPSSFSNRSWPTYITPKGTWETTLKPHLFIRCYPLLCGVGSTNPIRSYFWTICNFHTSGWTWYPTLGLSLSLRWWVPQNGRPLMCIIDNRPSLYLLKDGQVVIYLYVCVFHH